MRTIRGWFGLVLLGLTVRCSPASPSEEMDITGFEASFYGFRDALCPVGGLGPTCVSALIPCPSSGTGLVIDELDLQVRISSSALSGLMVEVEDTTTGTRLNVPVRFCQSNFSINEDQTCNTSACFAGQGPPDSPPRLVRLYAQTEWRSQTTWRVRLRNGGNQTDWAMGTVSRLGVQCTIRC